MRRRAKVGVLELRRVAGTSREFRVAYQEGLAAAGGTRDAAVRQQGKQLGEAATGLTLLAEQLSKQGTALHTTGKALISEGEAIVTLGEDLWHLGGPYSAPGTALKERGQSLVQQGRALEKRGRALEGDVEGLKQEGLEVQHLAHLLGGARFGVLSVEDLAKRGPLSDEERKYIITNLLCPVTRVRHHHPAGILRPKRGLIHSLSH